MQCKYLWPIKVSSCSRSVYAPGANPGAGKGKGTKKIKVHRHLACTKVLSDSLSGKCVVKRGDMSAF